VPSEGPGSHERIVVVAARNEADRIAATLAALEHAFPDARVVVADDDSSDETASLARLAGAEVSQRPRTGRRVRGKGGSVTAALSSLALPGDGPASPVVVLCDADLGSSAGELAALAEAVESGRCDLAIGSFKRSEGGGFGVALGFARWAIRDLTGLELAAPISGQRALRADLARRLLPLAAGFGMEIGMTVDAARAGSRIEEVELELAHRVTGRTAGGFVHRARQLLDFLLVYLSRRRAGTRPGSGAPAPGASPGASQRKETGD
jgi:glycosyltransferase involved in cell wall biosynthesis